MTSVFRISLDIHQTQSQVSIPATQGADNVRLIIRLTEKGNPFDIEDGSYAIFSAVKPDGNPLYNDCAIYRNSTIVYDFTPQTTAVEGITKCQIHLYDTYGRKLHSPRFQIVVHPEIYGNEIESTAEYKALASFVGIKDDIVQDISNNASAIAALNEKATTAGAITIPVSEWDDMMPTKAYVSIQGGEALTLGGLLLVMPGDTATKDECERARVRIDIDLITDQQPPSFDQIVFIRAEERPAIPLNFKYFVLKTESQQGAVVALIGVDAYGEDGGTTSGVDESAVRAIITAMLGNVANERQYSAANPPPYPVTKVNGQTGEVNLPIPSEAADVKADPAGTAETKTSALRQEVNTKLVDYDKSTSVNNKISSHNASTESHADLRLELQRLADRLNAALNSDDTSLDDLKEIVAYIKSNKTLIDGITSSKVNVTDIVNNLTTNSANVPLSAEQGVVLKLLIDSLEEIVEGKTTAEQVAAQISTALSDHPTTADMGTAISNATKDLAPKSAIPTVPSALPNPYALTILGKTYTGGKAVSLTAEEIMEAIKTASGGVVAYLDGNRLVLSGNLPDATYTAYYEVNGELIEIGDLTLGSITPDPVTYTIRWVNYDDTVLEIDEKVPEGVTPTYDGATPTKPADSAYTYTFKGWDKTVVAAVADATYTATYTHTAKPVEPTYTNILTSGAYTVNLNKRWSSSSKADTACNGMIYLKVPVADVNGKTIYFKGFPANAKASNQAPLWFGLDSTNTRIATLAKTEDGGGNLWTSEYLVDEGNGAYSIPINATTMSAVNTAGAYLLIDMATVNGSTAVTSLDGFIMTIQSRSRKAVTV